MAKSSKSNYSFSSFVDFLNENFVVLLVVGLSFLAGFFLGSMWTENQLLKNGGLQPSNGQAQVNDVAAQPEDAPAPVENMPEVTDSDYVRGDVANADIILVEYSDYECPFCARFHPTMQQVREEFGDQVAWVYRHYPLSIHPNAQAAAEGAECVGDLAGNEAFWTYSDALFEVTNTNGSLTRADLETAATDVGVGLSAFTECLDSGRMADMVAEDLNGGTSAGVQGTPGTIIVTQDGPQELIPGALPYASVQQAINSYL